MQIRTVGNSEPIEVVRRTTEWGTTDPLYLRRIRDETISGVNVTPDKVFGMPTVTQCIRLAAGVIADLSPIVYTGTPTDTNREPAVDSWQYALFNKPSLDDTSFNLYSDISASVDGYGNAFVQKVKAKVKRKTQVVELRVIPADMCSVKRAKDGSKIISVKTTKSGKAKDYGVDDILHVRGFNFGGLLSGIDLVTHFSASLGNYVAAKEFAGRYFQNDATPGGYIELPPETIDMDKTMLDEMLDRWEESHGGAANKHRPAILQGGAKFVTPTLSASAAQLIETQRFNVEDMARMMDFPVELLEPSRADSLTTEEILRRLISIHIKPRAARIKAALNEDPDLFADAGVSFDFNMASAVPGSIKDQADARTKYKQSGVLTANEVRAELGYPSHPDGDELQATPVGGAPNPGSNPGGGGDAKAEDQPPA